jgi:hypothetical protein
MVHPPPQTLQCLLGNRHIHCVAEFPIASSLLANLIDHSAEQTEAVAADIIPIDIKSYQKAQQLRVTGCDGGGSRTSYSFQEKYCLTRRI